MTKSIALAALAASLLVGTAGAGMAEPYHRHAARADAPLTVRRATTRVVVAPGYEAGYDAYAGPGAIVTAPVDVASRVVGGAFRVVNDVFPADPRSPLFLVGGPVYAAGRIAQVPFRFVQAPFRAAEGYAAF